MQVIEHSGLCCGESLQLDLRHAGALRLTAEERLNILALEERRFMLQCLAQQNTRGQSGGYSNTLRFVGLNLVDGSSTNRVVLSGFQQPQPARYSYFESRDFESRESPLEIVFWRATDPGCTLADYPGGIRPFAVPSGTVCRSSIRIGGNPGACSPYRPLSANRLSYDAVDDKPRNARFDPPEQRDHLGSRYERAYPFGILRADLRSQQPVGFVPWYLPGSPTNYPYPNNR